MCIRDSVVHTGRTTQVWDAEVTHRESGRTLALFRCTQMILYPRAVADTRGEKEKGRN